jgi:predicted TIM-barrel fold metal-dependent hydrolase
MESSVILRDPRIERIGLSGDRAPDPITEGTAFNFPVVSADSHFELTEDIFKDALPAHLQDQAPRVWFDRFWRIGDPTKQTFSDFATEYRVKHSCEGLHRWDVRKEYMRVAGVKKELLFPQFVSYFLGHPQHELREAVFKVYNEYIAKLSANSEGAYYCVAFCPNWWDPAKAKETIGHIKSLGLRTFVLPNEPGLYPSGKPIKWGDPELEPFWQAIEESGLPVCFHVIEKSDIDGPGGVGTFMLVSLTPFRRPFGMLAFGGVFDRHPGLKVAFVEGGISWVPPMLQDAEVLFDSFHNYLRPQLKHRPTHYWFENCHATFQMDRLGLEQLRYIGEDNVMWASDYPHTEGTYGYTRHSQEVVVEIVGMARAKKILGGTAIKLFKMDDKKPGKA